MAWAAIVLEPVTSPSSHMAPWVSFTVHQAEAQATSGWIFSNPLSQLQTQHQNEWTRTLSPHSVLWAQHKTAYHFNHFFVLLPSLLALEIKVLWQYRKGTQSWKTEKEKKTAVHRDKEYVSINIEAETFSSFKNGICMQCWHPYKCCFPI